MFLSLFACYVHDEKLHIYQFRFKYQFRLNLYQFMGNPRNSLGTRLSNFLYHYLHIIYDRKLNIHQFIGTPRSSPVTPRNSQVDNCFLFISNIFSLLFQIHY
jgi:hypothetical protein